MDPSCLTEDDVLALLAGSVDAETRDSSLAHVDTCQRCRKLVAEAARTQDVEHDLTPRLGRYVVQDVMGAGGMGLVYRAWDPALRRWVALKVMARGQFAPTRAEALLEEARALAELAHPNVVTIHDLGETEEFLFFSMELVEGQNLRQWLAEHDRSWNEIRDVFAQVGNGLAAIHAAAIVHGDVKPENILIGRDGRVRVGDFGLASSMRGPRGGASAGTPRYMAPERLGGGNADVRADQWAFCFTLWEALTETVASSAIKEPSRRSPPKLLTAIPRHRRPGRRIARALRRGLARDPDQRHGSMSALLAALATTPRPRSRWALVAVAGALAAVIASIAIVHSRDAAYAPLTELSTTRRAHEFCWVELATNDLARAERFYAGVFEWQFATNPSPEREAVTARHLHGAIADLYQVSDSARRRGVRPHWLSYIAVPDTDEAVRRALTLGATVLRGPLDSGRNGRFAVLRDPTGARIAVWQAGLHHGATFEAGTLGSWRWFERVADDSSEAAKFYTRWLGWSAEQIDESATQLLFHDSSPIAAIDPATRDLRFDAATWIIYFLVDDCDTAVARAKEQGGAVIARPEPRAGQPCRVVLADPEGILFGVIGR
jgi:predicted enzyme related to lactoylglutathione lyase/predicted Ser/Thr protein kinase